MAGYLSRSNRRLRVGLVVLGGLLLFALSTVQAAVIDHVHDAAGRLTDTTYDDGQFSFYSLDASGNLTSYVTTGSMGNLTHTISATATSGGQILPSGSVQVEDGQSQFFNIMPLAGYKRAFLLVDGELQSLGPTYSFQNVVADHRIKAGFVSLADDTDNDFLSDAWEMGYFGTLARDGTGDKDGDGLADAREQALGTSPITRDTEGDGLPDGWEIAYGLNPLANDAGDDPDGDGATNLREYQAGTDPTNSWSFPVNLPRPPMLHLLLKVKTTSTASEKDRSGDPVPPLSHP